MKIGELASRAGCDAQTVRYYEREGLLAAPTREASGYRRYGDQHLARVDFIRHCRALDIPLADVRQLLELSAHPDQSCAQVDGLIDSKIAQVTRRIAALQALRQQLVSLRRSCDGDPTSPCAILQSFMSATRERACACHPDTAR